MVIFGISKLGPYWAQSVNRRFLCSILGAIKGVEAINNAKQKRLLTMDEHSP
jgi:hypothetical protein